MPSVPGRTATTWKVTAQAPAVRPGPTGRYQPGTEVSFVTGKGVTGSVWVPESLFSPTTVRRMVAAKAATLDTVQGLTG